MTRRTAGWVSSSAAAPGVVTTSTGPCCAASAASSGVVSTTSPRKAVWTTRLVNLQDREERFLRDLDRAHLLHPLFPLLLLLEQFALAGHVAAVALGRHVLAQRADRLAGDHLGADRGLDHDLEQLARDQFPQLLGDLLAPLVGLVPVDDDGKGVHGLAVQQHVELDELGRPVFEERIVERGVAARDGLELVIEVEDDVGERELPRELDARRIDVVHALVYATPLLPELHDRADVFCRRDDPRLHVRLLDADHRGAVRHQAGILDHVHRAVGLMDVVFHVRHGADQVEVELALESLAHDLHVQEPQEPAAKPEPERHRGLGLVVQRGVVQLQFGERVPEFLELLGVGGIEPGEHHRLDLAVAGEERAVPVRGVEHGVARPRLAHATHVCDEVSHFPRLELLGGLVAQLQVADLVHVVRVVLVGAKGDRHPWADRAVHDSDAGNRPAVAVVVRVENQGPQRRVGTPRGRRNTLHHGLEQLAHVGALLRGDAEDALRLRADQLVQLRRPVGLGPREVDLVQDGDDLESGVERQEEVRDRLRLDPLGRIDDEDGPLAGGEGARHLVGEVDVSGRVDQVQLVDAAVAGVVVHPHRVELDRDAALALEIHGVEHLLPHKSLLEGARELDQPVGQGRLAVVDVGHDAEVADVILAHVGGNIRRRHERTPAVCRAHPTDTTRSVPDVLLPTLVSMPPIIGWFDPTANGGAVRRAANSYLPGKGDQGARLAGLRRGDLVAVEDGRVESVNGAAPAHLAERPEFATLGAVHPSRALVLETPQSSSPRTAETQRVVDLICPFGFGQRALIVSPPKAGKTVMLQAVAEGIALNHPTAILLILLVDERPEEVSEMLDWGRGEVIASSFDLPHERHVAVADMVFEHARRQVELGRDVVIVLDSLTRLARSHNTTGRGSGRTMSGGLDANALAKPKGLFGAARAVPTGGSLTVIATALVETESRMDDVIFEEFKGTGNAELRLTRELADRRIYPAVDIAASGTRREELLGDAKTIEAKQKLRRALVGLPPEQAMQSLLQQMKRAKTNAGLLTSI